MFSYNSRVRTLVTLGWFPILHKSPNVPQKILATSATVDVAPSNFINVALIGT